MEKTDDKREEILRAALELIAERGFHGAPMSMIAEKAGVAAGTIYRYFEGKAVLINALHRDLEDKVRGVLQDGFPYGRPVRERFFHAMRELFRYFIAHPLHFRYLEQHLNSPYGISMRRERLLSGTGGYDILPDIIKEGTSQQILKDFPHFVFFALVLGPLFSLMRDHILNFVILDEDLIEKTTAACWDAIKL